MIDFAGIRIPISTIEEIKERGPISREEYRLLQGSLPARLGSPQVGYVVAPEWATWPTPKLPPPLEPPSLERIATPIVKPPPPPPPAVTYKCKICGATFPSAAELGKHMLTHLEPGIAPPPPIPTPAVTYKCKICGATFPSAAELGKHMLTHLEPGIAPPPPLPPEEEIPKVPPEEWKEAIEAKKRAAEKAIDELLDDWEQGVTQLEEALRTARAAELYNNPYATIHQHATKLLNRLLVIRMSGYAIGYAVRVAITEPITWTSQQRLRLDSLISRLEKLMIDCATEAKERKTYTVEEQRAELQSDWVTQTFDKRSQEGITAYQDITQQLRPTIPELGTVPPTVEPTLVDYSVEERMQAAMGQEPWPLAEAEAPAVSWAGKNWLPLTVMGGLGATALGVYLKKRKKRS